MRSFNYPKMNDFKLRFNDKDWNDSSIRAQIMNELNNAYANGFYHCIEEFEKDGMIKV